MTCFLYIPAIVRVQDCHFDPALNYFFISFCSLFIIPIFLQKFHLYSKCLFVDFDKYFFFKYFQTNSYVILAIDSFDWPSLMKGQDSLIKMMPGLQNFFFRQYLGLKFLFNSLTHKCFDNQKQVDIMGKFLDF